MGYMNDKRIISNTNCHKCEKGKYHFYELLRTKEDGHVEMYLRYKCDKCGHFCRRKYIIDKQLKMF